MNCLYLGTGQDGSGADLFCVVLCFHECHIILRYPAIPLAQLHMLNRHPASRYDVTNATKPFDIPAVNAEALVAEERANCEEYLEESPVEVELMNLYL